MSELHRALGDISSIRREMARNTEFRGYGPATLACTGVLALFAAALQCAWIPNPLQHQGSYLALWCATALLSLGIAGAQMWTRSRRMHSGLSDEMIRMAVEQFLPTLAAGLLLTVTLAHFVPAVLWMLPGLWQLLFGLGILSSCRFLPRPMPAAGIWYLLTGLTSLTLGGARALAPQTMAISFGLGQMLVASVLQFSGQEGDDGS